MIAAVGAQVVTPGTVWTTWQPDLGILVGILGLVVVYTRGLRRLRTHTGRHVGISRARLSLFVGGVVALAVALVSPLDAMATTLFSAHMVQHLLLIVVAAPLLVAGRLYVAVLPLWPVRWRRWWGRHVTGALRQRTPLGIIVAVVAHVAVVVVWHAPVVYDVAVTNDAVHALEHLTMLAAGLAFWVAMGAGRHAPVAAAAPAAFVVVLSFTLLSAAMTVASAPWYASHVTTSTVWGLSPLQDQQLAAAIMWVPGGMVYLVAAAATIVRWLRDDERSQQAAFRPVDGTDSGSTGLPRPGPDHDLTTPGTRSGRVP